MLNAKSFGRKDFLDEPRKASPKLYVHYGFCKNSVNPLPPLASTKVGG
jgi:hypothetical protein